MFGQKETLLIFGDKGVGKTKLIQQWFNHQSLSSSPIDYRFKTVTNKNGTFHLQSFEISSQICYQDLWHVYAAYSTSVLLIFDIARSNSFTHLKQNLETLQEKARPGTRFFLLANQAGANSYRAITCHETQKFAAENGLIYIEISTKSGVGLNTLTAHITQPAPKENPVAGPYERYPQLLQAVTAFKTKRLDNKAIQHIAKILAKGTQERCPKFYFTYHLDDLKIYLKRLQFTNKSLLNSALNFSISLFLTASIIGLFLAYCTGWLQANQKASGHSFMFFAFGAKQAAQQLSHQIMTEMNTGLTI